MINDIIRRELCEKGFSVESIDTEVQRIAHRITPLLIRILAFGEVHLVPSSASGFNYPSLGFKAYPIQDQSPYCFKSSDSHFGVESNAMVCFQRIVSAYMMDKGILSCKSQSIYVGGWGGDRDFPVYSITYVVEPSIYVQFVSALMTQIVIKGMEGKNLDSKTLIAYLNSAFLCVKDNSIEIALRLICHCHKVNTTAHISHKEEEKKSLGSAT